MVSNLLESRDVMKNYKIVQLMNENSLVGSYVTLEGTMNLHSGKISYVEGELFEIEFPQSDYYTSGDVVKVTIYTPEGMIFFDTSIIAQRPEGVILLFPSDIYSKILKRRQFPRVEISISGVIYIINDDGDGDQKNQLELPVEIHDISQGGIGFSSVLPIAKESLLSIIIHLETHLSCTLEIIHKRVYKDSSFYGCNFKDLSPDKMIALRAWILQKQIEARFNSRQSLLID